MSTSLIVAERAYSASVRLGFGDFARAGVPMTLSSMGVGTAWLLVI